MQIRKFFQVLVIGGAALATSAGTCSSGQSSLMAKGADGGGGQGGQRDAGHEKGGGTQGW